jgi:hypothetical protein
VQSLLLESSAFGLKFLLCFPLLAKALSFVTLPLLLLGQLVEVICGQLKLADPERVILVRYSDLHRAAESFDRASNLIDPIDRSLQLVRFHRSYQVVGLGIVCAKYQLRVLVDHGPALGG